MEKTTPQASMEAKEEEVGEGGGGGREDKTAPASLPSYWVYQSCDYKHKRLAWPIYQFNKRRVNSTNNLARVFAVLYIPYASNLTPVLSLC